MTEVTGKLNWNVKSLSCPGEFPGAAPGAHPVILPAMHTTGWHCGWPANRFPFARTQNGVSKPVWGCSACWDGFHFGSVDAWGHVHFPAWGCHSAMASFSPPLFLTLNIKKKVQCKEWTFLFTLRRGSVSFLRGSAQFRWKDEEYPSLGSIFLHKPQDTEQVRWTKMHEKLVQQFIFDSYVAPQFSTLSYIKSQQSREL